METPRITRKQIHIISRHSNWSATGIKRALRQEGVYADKAAWAKFTSVALLGLGVAFALAGVIFFFAFNWHNLHKFVKLGIVQGLVVMGVLVVLFATLKPVIKNVILTGVSVLVGLLFAVFGQIYQTGADTYDFFLGWSVFIFIWAIVAEFAPLWLILTLLINTTIVLYSEQVGPNWPTTTLCLILFGLNVFTITLAQWFYRSYTEKVPVILFTKLVALNAAACITISIVSGISVNYYQATPPSLWVALPAMIAVYGLAISHSIRTKSLYYLCIIPLSVIIIIASWIIRLFNEDSAGTFLLVGLFVVVSITVMVNVLITLNKSWHAGE